MNEFEMIIHYDRIGDGDMFNCHGVGKLVRCKDCKHYQAQDPTRPTTCAVGLEDNLADEYCSRGERREDDKRTERKAL